ncbi:MAG: polymer-forming cytoskeletal protein [Nitrospirae bacterium]|nr:polymer-forming cytoskeletal protein [Nitrospirota bacterium]
MFNKKNDRIETLIGSNTTIKGEIDIKGTIRIDGRFEGTIKADWIVIGESGYLKGDALADGVIVGGTVEGNISTRESVEINSSGKVVGDVQTQKLVIIEGGLFEGRSKMQKEETKVVELPKGQKAEQLKSPGEAVAKNISK